MSYLKTINIQHLTSGTNNIVLDANGNMTCAGTISAATPTGGMRNKIINGDMRIDQRNAGAANNNMAATTTIYLVDRWYYYGIQSSKFNSQQNAGSVTPPAGFTNYLGLTSTSTYSVVSSDYFNLRQAIEGYNVSDLAFGTSSAKTVTLSFWVRSSLTGTFSGVLSNKNFNRCYPFTYRINTANTWEYETITIPGDTSGSWDTDNTQGLIVTYNLGAGSSYVGTAGSWTSSTVVGATGSINVVGTSGATFYITGIQVETGSVATAFERRPYGTELALCQRYYQVYGGTSSFLIGGYGASGGDMYNMIIFPTQMRAAPTMASTGTWTNNNITTNTPKITRISSSGFCAFGTLSTTGSWYIDANNSGSLITASIEL